MIALTMTHVFLPCLVVLLVWFGLFEIYKVGRPSVGEHFEGFRVITFALALNGSTST